ncbi:MAG TPA: hypothetical protein VLC48_00435, partial [Gemmatimonadota bacterium]|nr:hypothetical protein [Gemmatimonadota bacterium]
RVRQGRDSKPGGSATKRKVESRSAAYVTRAEQALSRALGTNVRVKLEAAERGRIEIPFRDSEDFERVVESIVGVGGVT